MVISITALLQRYGGFDACARSRNYAKLSSWPRGWHFLEWGALSHKAPQRYYEKTYRWVSWVFLGWSLLGPAVRFGVETVQPSQEDAWST
jgi:hypothetical protein